MSEKIPDEIVKRYKRFFSLSEEILATSAKLAGLLAEQNMWKPTLQWALREALPDADGKAILLEPTTRTYSLMTSEEQNDTQRYAPGVLQ